MDVTVNGENKTIAAGATVASLLEELRLVARTIVVERNGHVVPRDQFGSEALAEGDSLELVRIVGGG